MILNSCQYLESIKIWCGWIFLSEKEALEAIATYSPKCFHELIFYHIGEVHSILLPKELEYLLQCWKDLKPSKSLSLIIDKFDEDTLDTNDENMKIIKKYINLGTVKKFEVIYEDAAL